MPSCVTSAARRTDAGNSESSSATAPFPVVGSEHPAGGGGNHTRLLVVEGVEQGGRLLATHLDEPILVQDLLDRATGDRLDAEIRVDELAPEPPRQNVADGRLADPHQ